MTLYCRVRTAAHQSARAAECCQIFTDFEQLLYATYEKTNTINSNNREIASLNQSNKDLKTYLEEEVSADLSSARFELDKLSTEKENLLEEKLKVTEQFNYNGVIGEMLRDTGIKTKIIKQYRYGYIAYNQKYLKK